MTYPFMTLEDKTGIAHSDIIDKNGKENVKVYFEQPVNGGFNSAECWLPEYEWTLKEGFSEEQISYFQNFLESTAHIIFELARSESGHTLLDSYARLLQHIAEGGGNTGCLVTNGHSFHDYTGYLRNDLGLEDDTVIFGEISNVMPYIPSISNDLYTAPVTGVSQHYQYPKEPEFYRPMVNLKKRKGTK